MLVGRNHQRRQPPEWRQPAPPRAPRVRACRTPRGRPSPSPSSPDGRGDRSAGYALPALLARPARPVTCVRIWNVRSAARGSPRSSPRSASSTPTKVSFSKWCPLATSCVPIIRSYSPRSISAKRSLSCWFEPMSDDSTAIAHAQEPLRRLLGHPLDPRPDRGQQIVDAALGAHLRRAHLMAAMVAHQHAAKPMLHQPGRAIRTLVLVPARLAASAAHSPDD